MKLVAARDFYNSKPLGIVLDPKNPLFRHAGHVFKSARFEIGKTENFKELPEAEKFQAGTLIKYGLAVLDCQENREKGVLDKIDAEAKVEFEAYKKATTKPPTQEELISAAVAKAVTEALSGKK